MMPMASRGVDGSVAVDVGGLLDEDLGGSAQQVGDEKAENGVWRVTKE